MQASTEPLLECELLSPTGLFLITEDELGVAPYVLSALQQRGAVCALITTAMLRSPENLAKVIDQQRQIHGSVTGIVHLAPLAVSPMPDTLGEWRHYTQIHSKSLFQLLQLCATELQQAGQQQQGRVLAASLCGGYFGRDNHFGPGLPTGGSSNGLLKSLMTEWSGVHAKAIDFDTSLSPADMAEHIVQELLFPGGRVEVGYPQGKRTIFQTVPAPLNTTTPPQPTPSADWVVLVTGGARGITAEIARKIAIPGMRLVVVGRSPEPAEESPTTVGITDIALLRKALLEQVQSRRLSATPVQLERQLTRLLCDRCVRVNLERLRQVGAAVEYLAIDVRDPEAFGSLIDKIYTRYGRLNAVIHGAGVIEDKLIADKTFSSFESVFDTKVDSTFILKSHLRPNSLQLVVLFSSVAGRYGNRGQSDYAAANEVMNRLAWQMNQDWTNTRVVAINWGPWDSPGMVNDTVKRQFKERGIIPIPLAAGCEFFVQELRYGRKDETEIIAGEGPWEAHDAEQGQLKSNDLKLPVNPLRHFVFLSSQPQLQANSTVTLEHCFSLSSDPYLIDHCLDGKPVLPAAGALEWLAEFVQSAWPEWCVAQVRDLRVFRGIVLDTEAGRKVLFQARASTHADSESLQVTAEILDPNNNLPFYRASVILHPELSDAPTVNAPPLDSGNELNPGTAYNKYLFHGQRFQLLTSINCLNEQGIDAYVMPSQPSAWLTNSFGDYNSTRSWLFDPGLLDTAPQLAIVWARVQQGTTALPTRLGTVTRYGKSLPNKPLKLAFRVHSAPDNHTLVYDAVFQDENGQVHLHLENIESTCNATLNRLASHS